MKLKNFLKKIFSYSFNSLFIEYFITISIIVIIPLSILSFIYYDYYSASLEQELEDSNRHTALKVRDITDMIFSETKQLLIQLCINNDLEQIVRFKSKVFPDYNAINRYYSLISTFDITSLTSQYIHSISVYSIPNDYIFSPIYGGSERKYYKDNLWLDEAISLIGKGDFYTNSREIGGVSDYTHIISFNGYSPLSEEHKNGIITVNVDVNKISELITNINENYFEKIYIYDKSNNIILSNDSSYNEEENSFFEDATAQVSKKKTDSSIIKYKDTKYVATIINSEYSDFIYLFATPVDIYEVKLLNLRHYMLIVLLISILFTLALAYIMSLRVYKPIRNIKNIIDKDTHLSNEYKNRKKDEYNYIIDNMKRTFKLSHDVEKELKYRIELLDKAKTAALQSHINPHFLCNTLETVNFIALRELDEENEISKMVISLSSLLRQSLETENAFSIIEDEINHSKEYINIQKYRYRNRFSVDWQVDKKCLKLKVINIMIQPLLENSIYHGMKPLDNIMHIYVRVFKDSKHLIVEVEDDGVGMNNASLFQLNDNLKREYIQKNNHIGLMNVNQRIKILFGESYGLIISNSNFDSGVKAILMLPIIHNTTS